jgi:hypothetical protein
VLGGAAGWPLVARAQQGERIRRLGVLMGYAESDPETRRDAAAFSEALEKLGRTEGRNLRADWRFADSDEDRARTLAAEIVALKPDVIFATNTIVVRALQAVTTTVPIVFALVNNPFGAGFVGSLLAVRNDYSITASAVAKSFDGTLSLSALAVGALMTSSYLIDCTTGRLAGFSPLRIRPV